ncbi:hypothetical protein MMC13_008415 [Lambiella insularis]|nr:hypothetical protein [Lambiella insularis]
MAHSQPLTQFIQQVYGARAGKYDNTWHVRHAADFVKWAALRPGQHLLDLACGTGLVTIPAASVVGHQGSVTGIDVAAAMLEIARGKTKQQDLQSSFIRHDITQLAALGLPPKFDAITCASAIPLVTDPGAALKDWAMLLKPGGLLVADVPTERSQIAGLVFEAAAAQVGVELPMGRLWVKDSRSLEELFEAAGLRVERSFVASGYGSATVFDKNEAETLFNRWLNGPFGQMNPSLAEDTEKSLRARQIFVKDFQSRAGLNGMIREDEGFYVVVGKKQEELQVQ